jgi:PcfJ-like protein
MSFVPATLGEIAAVRAELLRDENGVFGLAITNKENCPIITRPGMQANLRHVAALQALPRLKFFGSALEGQFADYLFTVLLARDGFDRRSRPRSPADWWAVEKEAQDRNRRRFHVRKRQAVLIINNLIREALGVADQNALRLARRFYPNTRYRIYHIIAGSERMQQLAETFPALVYWIADRLGHTHRRAHREEAAHRAIEAVERGALLKTVADILEVPMAYRGIKPGACGIVRPADKLSALLYAYLPATTAAQRRWLRAIRRTEDVGEQYTRWVARNFANLDQGTIGLTTARVSDLGDWVRASYAAMTPAHIVHALTGGRRRQSKLITRPFSPDMAAATVSELSDQWHQDVAMAKHADRPIPPAWRPAEKIAGIDFIPLTTAAEIVLEGRTMHHCVATYIDRVAAGRGYIYSVRNGATLATVNVERDRDGKVRIDDMRGPCNAVLPKPLQAKIRRWFQRGDWTLPAISPATYQDWVDEEDGDWDYEEVVDEDDED